MNIIYCRSCHKKIQSTFTKCPYCSLNLAQEIDTSKSTDIKEKESSILIKIKKMIITFLCILGVIFIIGMTWTWHSVSKMSSNSTRHTSTSNYTPEESTQVAVNEDKAYVPPQYRDTLETIDAEAMLDEEVSRDDFLMGVAAIRMQGHNCESISSVAPMYGGGLRYRCNNFTKKYEVIKENGVFQVKDDS